MIAYHGKVEVKKKYLARVSAHMKADEIIKGQYWQNGKGCAVGCTIHGSEHAKYETELGIPEWLARIEDTIFEGLPNDKAKTWPKRFLEAIKPGADLETIKKPFIIFILEQNLEYLDNVKFDAEKFPDVKAAIAGSRKAVEDMITAHKGVGDLSAAWSAASAAESAAESAARSAAWSAAESAAWSAAWSAASAAWSAASAAWSAASAAESAAESAARSAAWSAAASAAYEKYSDKLIELLEGAQ